jgi:hypothetical protein
MPGFGRWIAHYALDERLQQEVGEAESSLRAMVGWEKENAPKTI